LKTDPTAVLRRGWSLLTGVPGWPDAPVGARRRRALPLLLPFLLLVLLGAWKVAVEDPGLRAVQAAHAPLFTLEKDVATLRAALPESAARDSRDQASQVEASLLSGPAGPALAVALRTLAETSAQQGWVGSFQGTGAPPTDGGARRLGFLTASAELRPTARNARPWPTLLLLLDAFSSQGKQIDLTRVAIRADEEGNYSVEANLRLGYLLPHEKTAQ
jgi:hypothetical protein